MVMLHFFNESDNNITSAMKSVGVENFRVITARDVHEER